MAKKKNINADVVVGETNIKVEKNEKSTKVKVKTPKVDIELNKEDNKPTRTKRRKSERNTVSLDI